MLSGSELLTSLHHKGVKIWEDKGKLRYQAPTGVLLPKDLTDLQRLKNEILEILIFSNSSFHSQVRRRNPGCQIPLTSSQCEIWRLKQSQDEPEPPNCVTAMRILGALDTSLLRRCIDAVVQRHESLRTRIVTVNGTPRQQVSALSEYDFQVVDLSHVDRDAVDNEVEHLGQRFTQETIDVSLGPAFRAKLFRLSDSEHALFLVTDHIFSDGTSKRIVEREIWTLYDRSLLGPSSLLDDVPIQFADYAVWQERTHQSWLNEHATYWRDLLRDVPAAKIPIKGSTAEIETANVTVMRFHFGEKTTERLRTLAQRERTLLSTIVLSIYILAMARWCNQMDVVAEVVSDGRTRPELEQITGYIATHLVLRVQIHDTDSILQLVKRTEVELYAALEHSYAGYLKSMIPGYRSFVWFNWMPDNAEWSSIWQWTRKIESVSIRPYPFVQSSHVGFWPMFYYTDTDVNMTIRYRESFISAGIVESLASYVHTFAQEFARAPDASIASVMVMAPREPTRQTISIGTGVS